MKHVWKPQALTAPNGEVIEPTVEGEVVVNLPKYGQRLRYLKDANFKADEDGKLGGSVDTLEASIVAVELAEKHIESVKLKVIKTGEELNTVDDLQYSPHGEQVLTDVGFLVLNGVQLGND